jgi:predicted nucleic acid-binding protein
VRFWDASAIVPLLVRDTRTEGLMHVFADDPAAAVWWLTPVECWSALARMQREQRLTADQAGASFGLLDDVALSWTEVPPIDRVRDQARRLVGLHPLRSADALQLAAALVLCDFEPKTLPFVTLDARLAVAARREGFEVLGL